MNSRLILVSACGVLTALAIMTSRGAASAQVSTQTRGTIRKCGAASCEDETALVTALDTVLRASGSCVGHKVLVAADLYWNPFAFDEGSAHDEQPSEPAMGTWGRRGRLALSVYSPNVTLIDLRQQASVRQAGCLMVFSTPTWLGPDRTRVIVAVQGAQAQDRVEWYVFLSRRADAWKTDRLEVGFQR